jgi:23S rRNA (cytosine1962-C5)-methyltransferase
VLRLDGEAVRVWRDDLVRILVDAGRELGITHVFERSRGGDGEPRFGGAPPVPVEIEEHGARFLVDVVRGQKTGFFLDQRDNRVLVRHHARGLEVANLFGYTGGLSVQAALGGAARVTTVDSARGAIDAARANFTRNGLDPAAHAFEVADAFEWLERTARDRQEFGLVVVDPPSFAPSARARPRALAAYRKLNAMALRVVADGGLLATASCSSHVTEEAFLGAVQKGASDARRRITMLEVRGQPADHPAPDTFPEGRYLKLALLRSTRRALPRRR